ncbi:MAG: sulfite exporter TauE/SafE family protein [Caulobacterales bacterium]|nr:sulfite exporter TauE/SafE family protein [Caulobacterales bacterium]
MTIYLPIAEMSVDIFLLLAIGGAVGFLSGMFGVGGGFLMTPLLIFIGVPPAVAVSTEANQIVASSVSGALAHFRRGALDMKMGLLLTAGGACGSGVGVQVFSQLREAGQLDLFISLAYVLFLSIIGGLMLMESLRAVQARRAGSAPRRPRRITALDILPLKTRFPRSGLYESAIPPILIGFTVGILAALMGVGGGFIMVPAMIYLLRMPTNVVVGTSLFQITFVTGFTTVMQAVQNQTVDVVLAFLLIIGGVIGAQLGARAGHRFRGEELRAGLAILVLLVGLKLATDLFRTPLDPYAVL